MRLSSIRAGRRSWLTRELLRPLAGVDLAGVEVAVRVDRQVVDPVELAGLAARPAEGRLHGAAVARQREHLVVAAVGHEQPALLRVAREDDVPHGAVPRGARLDRELADEAAVLVEHLD